MKTYAICLLAWIMIQGYSQGIEITMGGQIACIGKATIEIEEGDFINHGSFFSGQSIVTISANDTVAVQGSSPITFYQLKVNVNPFLKLANNIFIQDTLFLQNGIMIDTTNTYFVHFKPGSIAAIMPNSFIDAICKKEGNEAFLFPIGNRGYPGFVSISAPTLANEVISCRYYHENPSAYYPVNNKDTSLRIVSSNEYWLINHEEGSSKVLITLYWNAASGVAYPDSMVVARWNGTFWENKGSTDYGGNSYAGFVTSDSIDNFSAFTLASISLLNPLPIIDVRLQSEIIDNQVTLSAILNEEAIKTYAQLYWGKILPEKTSLDIFQQTTPQPFVQTTDRLFKNGLHYYFLYGKSEQTLNLLGYVKFSYSVPEEKIEIYPNPCASNEVYLKIPQGTEATYYFTNMQNILYQQGKINQNKINVSSLPVGTYILTLQTLEGNCYNFFFVKM